MLVISPSDQTTNLLITQIGCKCTTFFANGKGLNKVFPILVVSMYGKWEEKTKKDKKANIFSLFIFHFLLYLLALQQVLRRRRKTCGRATFSLDNKNKNKFILYCARFFVPLHRIWEQALPSRHTFVCFGEMVEWSITPVLKTGVPRGTGGSNPSLSAESKIDDF